jgi:putative phosphoribosyl transferase
VSTSRPRYRDRPHAGAVLAEALTRFAGRTDVAVLALPRGGLPVAVPVATRLSATLGLVVVRKLGVPGHAELAMGALASVGGQVELIRNRAVITSSGVSAEDFDRVASRERVELEQRLSTFGQHARPPSEAKVAILVDDGLATGSSMLAAVQALQTQQWETIVVAVPVAAREAVDLFDVEVVCPYRPKPFLAVGQAYADFTQVPEQEVRRLLGT